MCPSYHALHKPDFPRRCPGFLGRLQLSRAGTHLLSSQEQPARAAIEDPRPHSPQAYSLVLNPRERGDWSGGAGGGGEIPIS